MRSSLVTLGWARLVSLVVAVIVISSGLGYFEGVSNQHTITAVTVSTTSTQITDVVEVTTTNVLTSVVSEEVNVTQSVPYPSLGLIAGAYTQNITSGENVSIVSEVYNSLPALVGVEAPPITDPSEAWCPFSTPTAVTLYLGYYTFANLTGAVYLLQYNGANEGACSSPPSIVYTFLPNSDEAYLVSNQHPPSILPGTINETVSLSRIFWKSCGRHSELPIIHSRNLYRARLGRLGTGITVLL